MEEDDVYRIGGVEFFGVAEVEDGVLNIGGVEVPFTGYRDHAAVYVRRMISPGKPKHDGAVFEIAIARHSGLAQAELKRHTEEAQEHPLGPLAYWRMTDKEDDAKFMALEGLTAEELEELDRRIAVWKAECQLLEESLKGDDSC